MLTNFRQNQMKNKIKIDHDIILNSLLHDIYT